MQLLECIFDKVVCKFIDILISMVTLRNNDKTSLFVVTCRLLTIVLRYFVKFLDVNCATSNNHCVKISVRKL